MNDRLEQAQHLYFCPSWSTIFVRSQWRFINCLMVAYPLLWAPHMCEFITYPSHYPELNFLPRRTPWHPRMRWMIINIRFVIQFDYNFQESTVSIFYIIMTFPITRTSMFFTLPISERSICIYIYIYICIQAFS